MVAIIATKERLSQSTLLNTPSTQAERAMEGDQVGEKATTSSQECSTEFFNVQMEHCASVLTL